MSPSRNVDEWTLARICREHRISRLALVDPPAAGRIGLLVDFFPDARPGPPELQQLGSRLADVFGGGELALHTRQELAAACQYEVLRSAQVQYVAG